PKLSTAATSSRIPTSSAAGTPRPTDASSFAPVVDRLLGALQLARALVGVDEDALARRIDGAETLSALQLAHARLRVLAAGALLVRFGTLFFRFLLGLLALLLALLERLLGRERLVLILVFRRSLARRRRRRRRRGGACRRRPEARHLARIAGRRIAVLHPAVVVDPFVKLR